MDDLTESHHVTGQSATIGRWKIWHERLHALVTDHGTAIVYVDAVGRVWYAARASLLPFAESDEGGLVVSGDLGEAKETARRALDRAVRRKRRRHHG